MPGELLSPVTERMQPFCPSHRFQGGHGPWQFLFFLYLSFSAFLLGTGGTAGRGAALATERGKTGRLLSPAVPGGHNLTP